MSILDGDGLLQLEFVPAFQLINVINPLLEGSVLVEFVPVHGRPLIVLLLGAGADQLGNDIPLDTDQLLLQLFLFHVRSS